MKFIKCTRHPCTFTHFFTQSVYCDFTWLVGVLVLILLYEVKCQSHVIWDNSVICFGFFFFYLQSYLTLPYRFHEMNLVSNFNVYF